MKMTMIYKTKFRQVICLVVLAAMTNMLGGCSVVGFTAGAMIDEALEKKSSVAPHKIDSLRKGKKITAYLKDGRRIEGRYRGLSDMDSLEYALRYEQFCADTIPQLRPPGLHDNIDIVIKNNTYRNNCFRGFGYRNRKATSKAVYAKNSECYYISTKSEDKTDITDYYLDQVSEIVNSDASSNRAYVLAELINRGEMPLLTTVVFSADSSYEQIPLDDIIYVQYASKNGKWKGLGLGLVIDLALLASILTQYKGFGGSATLGAGY
jgi:lysozyme family protein